MEALGSRTMNLKLRTEAPRVFEARLSISGASAKGLIWGLGFSKTQAWKIGVKFKLGQP